MQKTLALKDLRFIPISIPPAHAARILRWIEACAASGKIKFLLKSLTRVRVLHIDGTYYAYDQFFLLRSLGSLYPDSAIKFYVVREKDPEIAIQKIVHGIATASLTHLGSSSIFAFEQHAIETCGYKPAFGANKWADILDRHYSGLYRYRDDFKPLRTNLEKITPLDLDAGVNQRKKPKKAQRG